MEKITKISIILSDIQMVRPELFVTCCGQMVGIQHQEQTICEFILFVKPSVSFPQLFGIFLCGKSCAIWLKVVK